MDFNMFLFRPGIDPAEFDLNDNNDQLAFVYSTPVFGGL